jgi:hypothetical protein
MTMRVSARGFALFLTLGITGILVMLLTATLFSARGGSVFTQDYHAKRAAYYAAESGLAILQQRMELDTEYRTDSVEEPTPFGNGTFTIRFGHDDCVNNLEGTDPVPGPLGDVPAGSAFVRIEGEALGHRETIECMLGRKSSDFIPAAVVASGRIHFDGNIDISGRDSNDLASRTPADVISNYQGAFNAASPPLSYDKEPGETARIEGTVRSASENASAISNDLRAAASNALTDQSPVPLKNFDIISQVRAKAAHPAPPITTGSITGTFYRSGNHTVPADLVLDNADLYIEGDLTVIGSITGRGSIYVTGDTTFSGDSIVAANEDGIALYSYGNVALTGFDGTRYMDELTANAGDTIEKNWTETKATIGDIVERVRSGNLDAFRVPAGTQAYIDALPHQKSYYYWRSPVAVSFQGMGHTLRESAPHPIFGETAQQNTLWHLGKFLELQTDAPAQRFMLKKIGQLRDLSPGQEDPINPNYGNPTPPGQPAETYWLPTKGLLGRYYDFDNYGEIENFRRFNANGGISDGMFMKLAWLKTMRTETGVSTDGYADFTDTELDLALTKMANWLEDFEYDKLGSSYFQGAIYTRGAFFADNQVTIIGSVAVVADPKVADGKPDFRPNSNVKLRPGDLYLGSGTNITYVSDIVPGAEPEGPKVGVSYWLR